IRPVGADDRHQDNHAGVGEEAGDLSDPADVLSPVLGGEPQVGVEPMADVVAVQAIGGAAFSDERLLDRSGDRRLARPRKTGQPDRRTGTSRRPMPLLSGDSALVPDDVVGHYSVGPTIIAAPTVLLVASSTRMNAPV